MSEAALTPDSSFSLEDLKNLTDGDMLRVNQVITDNLVSEVALINQLSQHIILSGGKRLRPMLVILAAKACHYQGEDDALLAAVEAYARNLNTHPAYKAMRAERAMMRARGERPSGRPLAGTLLRYSERGPAYIRTIRTIMGNFGLPKLDGATLEPGTAIHVIKR